MLIYLDTNVVIYLIEQTSPQWGARASARIAAARANQDRFAVSDLTRLECRVGPIAANDSITLGQFDTFFQSAEVQVLLLTTAVCDRATIIRARHRYRTPDALNLAAAVDAGCDIFLTNDLRLRAFSDITVEALP